MRRRPRRDDAHRFTEALARRLGITAEHVLPAFEDPAERMLKEGALPANIDPADPKIDDPIERARIMREFERHLSAPAGYVLPVQRWSAQARPRLDQRALAVAPRPAVPGARRFADRLSAAAQLAALSRAGRRAASGAGRSVRGARRAARSGGRGARMRRRRLRQRRRCAPVPPWYAQSRAACRAASPIRAGAHRAGGRAARRQALRVHAAGRAARGLSRAAGRGRGDRRRARPAGPCRRLSAAARSAR